MADLVRTRALNRALLARQLLLDRVAHAPVKAIEHLVGLQAQVPNSPYLGVWSRLDGFRLDQLSRLVRARRVVRIGLLRGTIHQKNATRRRQVVESAVRSRRFALTGQVH